MKKILLVFVVALTASFAFANGSDEAAASGEPIEISMSYYKQEITDSLPLRPRYNIAPSQDVLALPNTDEGPTLMRWGLIPSWAKDEKIGYRTINARAETVADIVAVDDFIAEAVEDLALLVHHVVIFEQALADAEVVLLDFFLRTFDGLCDQAVLNALAFIHGTHAAHNVGNAVRTKQAHEIILKRQIKT